MTPLHYPLLTMTEQQVHFYGAIEKFDAGEDDSLMVSGIASTEAVDADGEIITADAMRKALPAYLQCGTVREMHGPIAAGRPISAFVDDDGRTHFTAKIVDSMTVKKIKEGVLKGFSVGGRAVKRLENKITEILLKDISVVDIPNNPESFFTVVKFDKPEDKCNDPECKTHTEAKKHEEKTKEKSMTTEEIQKFDALAEQVKALASAVDSLTKSAAPADKLEKALTEIGDLRKVADEANMHAQNTERSAIISKMSAEGRVAFKDTGTAYTVEELQKMELPMLKFAAKNGQILPTEAKAIFKGDAKPAIAPEIRGSDRVEKAWESKYSNLAEMKARS